MTDEPDQPTQGEDPASDAVRRLLADARHDQPIPGDVAARMDRVLADLAAGGSANAVVSTGSTDDGATVVPTGSTDDGATMVPTGSTDDTASLATVTRVPVQRRRRAAALLSAAAAIVVCGVVLAEHHPGSGSTVDATSGGATSAGANRYSADAGPTSRPGTSPQSSEQAPRTESATKAEIRAGRVVVRGATFAADARAGQALLAGHAQHLASPAAACPTSSADQQVLAAVYDHAPAALVYHRPDGSTQIVDLVVCGSAQPIHSVTLPAP